MLLRMFCILLFAIFVQQPLAQQPGINKKAAQRPDSRGTRDQTPTDCSAYIKTIEQLNARIKLLDKRIEELDRKNGELNGANTRLSKEVESWKRRFEAGDSKAGDLTRQLESLRRESEQLKRVNADLESRLKQSQAAVLSLKDEMTQLNASINSLKAENSRLLSVQNEYAQLRGDMRNLIAEKESLNQHVREMEARLGLSAEEIQEARQARQEASGRAESVFEQLEKEPQAILASVKSSLEQGAQNQALGTITSKENGEVRIIRDLVIGILDISYKEKEVTPGKPFLLTAEFKPNPILLIRKYAGMTEEDIKWHIELDYQPLAVQAEYDQEKNSGRTLRRGLDPLGTKETWVWVVTAPKNFQSDQSKINVITGYTWGGEERSVPIDSQDVIYTEKIAPGLFALAFTFFKENLTFILGALTAIVGIFATITTIKKSKVETALNELKLRTESGGKVEGQTA